MHYKLNHKNHRGHFLHRFTRNLKISSAAILLVAVVGGRFAIGQMVLNDANTGGTVPKQGDGLVTERTPRTLTQLESVSPVQSTVSERLQTYLDNTLSQFDTDERFAIHVAALDGTFSASVHSDQQFNAASLYKTLAAYQVLQRVDRGELSLVDTRIAGHSLDTCIELAITVSDNPCGVALQSYANPYTTDVDVSNWGYSATTLSGHFPQTSAADQHLLLKDIYEGKRLSDASRDILLGHLSNQKVLNRTPVYTDATLFLKTGDLEGAVHSAAIIETEETAYTISILTDNWDTDILSKYSAISDIHTQTHELIQQ